jgi:predicted nucleotidyltransferase
MGEFEAATAFGTAPHKRDGRILMVVLFGSYARGDCVDDPKSGYASDYDLLVVVNQHRLTDVTEFWAKADDELLKAYAVTRKISAPVNFIVHDLADLNQRLRHGAYFFTDILRDGIVLYEAGRVELAKPVPLTPEEALKEAKGYFEEWFESAVAFQKGAAFYVGEGRPKEAAFSLHQATE